MSDPDHETPQQTDALLALYDATLPQVYGYLVRRCGSAAVAEDLTSETYLAAVDALRRDRVPELSAAWLIRVARNKLVDHWRRRMREERKLALVQNEPETIDDPWDVLLDARIARHVLDDLGVQHRAALMLRYLDDLPVAEVARHLDRTEGATEVLLVRARKAFRATYEKITGEEER